MEDRKAILVVSSGTSNIKARKESIEALEERIAREFTDFEVRRAFTSMKIIDRIRTSEGTVIDSPSEALKRLCGEGFNEVILQPMQIIPGMEYEKLIGELEQYRDCFRKAGIGKPLLYSEEDYPAVVAALKGHLPELSGGQAAVLMGHGSSHSAQRLYLDLQEYIDKAAVRAYIGTIKGTPGISDIIDRLRRSGIREAVLMPFMLVAGNHALMDMASDEEYSWKTLLTRAGFKVDIYLKGLGENTQYQEIYLNRIRETMENS
ncbi:MAG: sirohydrochlorin cobaltochelatase [Bacillota bacterium]|nr:sirohydrochlorin cobaltochelatase [Bacillota bacterium]